jgi:hypothetical protein
MCLLPQKEIPPPVELADIFNRKRSAYGVSLIQVLHLLAIWLVTGPAAAAP